MASTMLKPLDQVLPCHSRAASLDEKFQQALAEQLSRRHQGQPHEYIEAMAQVPDNGVWHNGVPSEGCDCQAMEATGPSDVAWSTCPLRVDRVW